MSSSLQTIQPSSFSKTLSLTKAFLSFLSCSPDFLRVSAGDKKHQHPRFMNLPPSTLRNPACGVLQKTKPRLLFFLISDPDSLEDMPHTRLTSETQNTWSN